MSVDNYKDTVLLDIIDFTEQDTEEDLRWALFNDIYKQRESIRYNLGSEEERKTINRMLKRKNSKLMEKMAAVSEREDTDALVEAINRTIVEMDHEAYVKILGEYAESNIQKFLEDALKSIGALLITNGVVGILYCRRRNMRSFMWK